MNHIDPSHPDQRPHRPDERQAAAPRQAGADRIIPASCTPPHTAARRLLPTGTTRGAQAGFTLIELMVATAITAILSSIAYPSFQSQVLKARRADALVAIVQVQMAQERWRANHSSYGSLSDVGAAATSPSAHYGLQVASASRHVYEVLAVATGTQERDSACRYIRMTMDGANMVQASGPDSTTGNSSAQNRQCWSL